jgi:hypothetical protein
MLRFQGKFFNVWEFILRKQTVMPEMLGQFVDISVRRCVHLIFVLSISAWQISSKEREFFSSGDLKRKKGTRKMQTVKPFVMSPSHIGVSQHWFSTTKKRKMSD